MDIHVTITESELAHIIQAHFKDKDVIIDSQDIRFVAVDSGVQATVRKEIHLTVMDTYPQVAEQVQTMINDGKINVLKSEDEAAEARTPNPYQEPDPDFEVADEDDT